ncbi:hypothetical protein SDC9_66452 [bioreactor metagenome]|uniref:Uncharacterized protein n=1 Tax=bioreactor metagenome TaxID=1076179 RepID=A0A644XV28_9ZZZZ
MAEDPEGAGDEPVLDSVTLRVLVDQEANDRLPDSETYGWVQVFHGHSFVLRGVIGSRGSTSPVSHSWRSQV